MFNCNRYFFMFSDNISDSSTMKREIEPLLQIYDAYPKMIIARTGHENYLIEGVIVTDISTWLLKQ